MSQLLARCPYCQWDLTLYCQEFHRQLDLARRACPHLVYLTGWVTDWQLCPDGSTQIVGTTSFGWSHPHVAAVDRSGDLQGEYLVGVTYNEGPCDAHYQVVDMQLEEEREMTDAEYRYQLQVARLYGTTLDRDRPISDVDVEAKLLFAADAVAFIDVARLQAHALRLRRDRVRADEDVPGPAFSHWPP